MPDEKNVQSAPEITQPQPSPEATAGNAEPIPDTPAENPTPNQSSQSSDDTGQVSEPKPVPVSSDGPIPDAPTPPTDSASPEMPPEAPQASPSPENTSAPQNPNSPATALPEASQTSITTEKSGDKVTITEVMTPPASPVPAPEVSKTSVDTSSQSGGFLKGLLPKLKEKLAFRTERRLSKIVEFAQKKAEKGESIQNDEVEKLLHISDSTAARLLKKLVQRGQLKSIGNPKWPRYSPN